MVQQPQRAFIVFVNLNVFLDEVHIQVMIFFQPFKDSVLVK